MGLLMLAIWCFERQRQRSLGTMGLGIVLTGLAISIQTMLPPAMIGTYAPLTGILYLAGAWLFGRSMSLHFQVPFPRWLAGSIVLITLAGLYYFSSITPSLNTRIVILSTGLAALQLLPFAHGFRRHSSRDPLDTLLYITYFVFGVYTLLRPAALLAMAQYSEGDLVHTLYWFITMLGGLLFCMTFASLLLAASIRRTLARLQHERDIDPLTQLRNRRALDASAQQWQQQTTPMSLSVLMCDIDHFKAINDNWGHAYGDQVLCHVADCLRASTRSHDTLIRHGGEEFLILLPHTGTVEARMLAERIQRQLAQDCYRLPNHDAVTLSLGITALAPREPLPQAIARADQALYQAKTTGRDKIVVYTKPETGHA